MSDALPFVVATAGHVDHGKSALILRLTGTDPDRWAEEKRRGMTIDLGFAWTTLASGREIGFVDVPGHERFVRNMLAGVGPVRQVLFVVAADEGWKPQSEEHLQIVDVLGVHGAVVALTKRDLVDDATLAARTDEVRARLAGTVLARAPVVACSSHTGEGLEELRGALDAMLAAAPPPESDLRPRLFLDRAFTIRGAGTVVTGTLSGGPLAAGREVEILPSGHRARIRGLQTHKRAIEVARPVSRVAVNLVGTAPAEVGRGDVLGPPDQWRATSAFEGRIRPVRGLGHPLSARGAYKLHVGSAERDARVRLYGVDEVWPGGEAYLRVTFHPPVVLDVGDRFVLRDAGRRETVAGGSVLDVDPPARPGPDPIGRLARREGAERAGLAGRLVEERGVVRAADVPVLTGASANDAQAAGGWRAGGWLVSAGLRTSVVEALRRHLAAEHAAHPLRQGIDVAEVRAVLAPLAPPFADPAAADDVLRALVDEGVLARDGTAVRLPGHRPSTAGRDDADRLVATVATGEPAPPSLRELREAGFGRELVEAAVADGRLVRISPELVVTPAFLARAETELRRLARDGVTVSAFREALATSRKYALPLLEHFDRSGLTRREGDVRRLRG